MRYPIDEKKCPDCGSESITAYPPYMGRMSLTYVAGVLVKHENFDECWRINPIKCECDTCEAEFTIRSVDLPDAEELLKQNTQHGHEKGFPNA